MDVDDARTAIEAVWGREPRSVIPIGDGWDHWTWLADDRWIFRFPRREDSARSLAREVRLLPELAKFMDVAVPEPSVLGSWNGHPFAGYALIDGRPMVEADGERAATTTRLVDIVDQIHAFPVHRAAELLGDDASTSAWAERYQRLAATTTSLVAPLLSNEVRSALDRRFEAFLERVAEFEPVLVHGDLGPAHIRIDEKTGEPVGIIDFGDATIGDPAIDYVGFRIAFGSQITSKMAARSQHQYSRGFVDRIEAYLWIGSVHAVLYGIAEDDSSIVDDGLAGLASRLSPTDV